MSRIFVEYRLQPRIFFAIATIVFYFLSKMSLEELFDPKAVVKFKGFVFSKTAGEVFLYSASIFLIVFFILCLSGFILTFVKREAVLSEESISLPIAPFRRAVATIMYSDILSHEIKRAGNVRVLVVRHKTGAIKIPSSVFSSEEDFGLIYLSVANRKLMAGL
jgi:hypothetical protein